MKFYFNQECIITSLPQFPFFEMIYAEVEKVVEVCREKVNNHMNILSEEQEFQIDVEVEDKDSYLDNVVNSLSQKVEEIIEVCCGN